MTWLLWHAETHNWKSAGLKKNKWGNHFKFREGSELYNLLELMTTQRQFFKHELLLCVVGLHLLTSSKGRVSVGCWNCCMHHVLMAVNFNVQWILHCIMQWRWSVTFFSLYFTFTFRAFRHFCPKRLTVIHTYIHTLMVVAAMRSADQHIRSSLRVRYLAQGHLHAEIHADQGNRTSELPITRRLSTVLSGKVVESSSLMYFVIEWTVCF